MKFIKKPVVIDAWQWDGVTVRDAQAFTKQNELPNWSVGSLGTIATTGLIIPTLESDHVARTGDWIIRGVKGEYYPCKPDIFSETYDPVNPSEVSK